MSSKNNTAIQISDAINKTMEEVGKTAIKFSICAGELMADVTELVRKINMALHEVYLVNGAPYGDSQAGFFIWLKEEQERAQNGDQHDQ